MKKEQIIDLARKAGLQPIYQECAEAVGEVAYEDWGAELEEFAALIAEAIRTKAAV